MFLSDISNALNETLVPSNPFFDVIFNFVDFHVLESVQDIELIGSMDNALQLEPNEMTNTLFDLEVSNSNNLNLDRILRLPISDEEIETALGLYQNFGAAM